MVTGHNYVVAGLVVSLACYAGAMVVLFKLAQVLLGRAWLSGAWSSSQSFRWRSSSRPSTASHCSCCSHCSASEWARDARWALAGLAGLLAVLTRSSGVVLVLPLAVIWVGSRRGRRPEAAGRLQPPARPRPGVARPLHPSPGCCSRPPALPCIWPICGGRSRPAAVQQRAGVLGSRAHAFHLGDLARRGGRGERRALAGRPRARPHPRHAPALRRPGQHGGRQPARVRRLRRGGGDARRLAGASCRRPTHAVRPGRPSVPACRTRPRRGRCTRCRASSSSSSRCSSGRRRCSPAPRVALGGGGLPGVLLVASTVLFASFT